MSTFNFNGGSLSAIADGLPLSVVEAENMADTVPLEAVPLVVDVPKAQRFAFVGHVLVDAALSGKYRLPDKALAMAKLSQLRELFASHDESTDDRETLTLWIRGYAVTPEEEAENALGNFAVLHVEALNEKLFTIKAIKLAIPAAKHPQRKRPVRPHPNWGHPAMIAIKKGKIWPTAAVARNVLDKLHREFPRVSIPGEDKLSILLYSKSRLAEGLSPTWQVQLRVAPRDDGTAIIEFIERGKTRRPLGGAKVAAAQVAGTIAAMQAGR
ncbi:MAG: hypothetical protein ACK5O1_01555 [Holosporales bacterium]